MNKEEQYEKTLFVSDIHLFHRRTPTYHIAANLLDFIKGVPNLTRIVFGGDVFDRSQGLPEDEVNEAIVFCDELLEYTATNGIALRVLEGTRSHDMRQSKLFVTLNSQRSNPADLLYVDTVSIVTENNGLTYLYVPDSISNNPDVVWDMVQAKLREHGLSKVDFGVMHGFFTYQMPPVASIAKKNCIHNEERYLSIVRHIISIGHVHLPSSYDRIFAQGSFDILSFGEISKKGGIVATLRNGICDTEFVENRNTYRYHIHEIDDDDEIDKALSKIESALINAANFPANISVRGTKRHVVRSVANALSEKFPNMKFFDEVKSKDEVVEREGISMGMDQFKVTGVTPDTVLTLTREFALRNSKLDADELVGELSEIINGTAA